MWYPKEVTASWDWWLAAWGQIGSFYNMDCCKHCTCYGRWTCCYCGNV